MKRHLISILATGGLLLAAGCGGVDELPEGGVSEEQPAEELETDVHASRTNVVICAGGYAPVRYWNPSSCGGTIHDYYPQGWHGWYETGGGCGISAGPEASDVTASAGMDYYFHPNNGLHGGWIESWRLCRY